LKARQLAGLFYALDSAKDQSAATQRLKRSELKTATAFAPLHAVVTAIQGMVQVLISCLEPAGLLLFFSRQKK